MGATEARKQSKSLTYDVGDDDSLYTTKSPSSARRYQQPQQPIEHDTLDDPLLQKGTFVQPRRSSTISNPPVTGRVGQSKPLKGVTSIPSVVNPLPALKLGKTPPSLLAAVVLGMLVMALLAISFNTVSAWWQVHQDDAQYGRPRTFQMDAVVGHGDSASNPTHIIFINLHRHVEIIELPGGDAAHARIYSGPVLYGDGQDLLPVTGEIRDVNGDGKPDLIVHIQDQQIVFINDGTQFRPLQQGEQIHL